MASFTSASSSPVQPSNCWSTLPLAKSSQSLEERFEKECLVDTNTLEAKSPFSNFLSPNEFPEGIFAHFKKAAEELKDQKREIKEAIIVSTGTERSFFDLIASDECKGLVIRDVNPKVKAYNDFIILLLRIAKTRKKFIKLTRSPPPMETTLLNKQILIITEKIKENKNLPKKAAEYYIKTIRNLSETYYQNAENPWISLEEFDCYNYHKNDALFLKLHKYAESGNIISTIGDINDLTFLKKKEPEILLVDTSNICDYRLLNLSPYNDVRVMWTQVGCSQTIYASFINKALTEEENKQFDDLRRLIKSCTSFTIYPKILFGVETEWMTNYLSKYFGCSPREYKSGGSNSNDVFNANVGACRSRTTLDWLKRYCETYIIQTPAGKLFNLHPDNLRELFTQTSAEDLNDILHHEKTQSFVKDLVCSWDKLVPNSLGHHNEKLNSADISTYLAFSILPGWKEEFEKLFSKPGYGKVLFESFTKKHYDTLAQALGGEQSLTTLLLNNQFAMDEFKEPFPFSDFLKST